MKPHYAPVTLCSSALIVKEACRTGDDAVEGCLCRLNVCVVTCQISYLELYSDFSRFCSLCLFLNVHYYLLLNLVKGKCMSLWENVFQ